MDCERLIVAVRFWVRMFERLDPWGFVLASLGCSPRNFSDWILLGLLCWLAGFCSGCLVVLFLVSRSVRNVLWHCLGVVIRELHDPPVLDRLARYRAPVHEHRA